MHDVREALARAGYTEAGLLSAIGAPTLAPVESRLLARRLDRRQPLTTLIALFWFCQSLPVADVGVDLEPFLAAGLVSVDDGTVRSHYQITPFDELTIAHDPEPGPRRRDHVMGVGPATRTLARLVPGEPVQSTLDVGTGSGVLACRAAGHSARVVATDITARAVELAELNAGLNDVGLDLRRGDLFSPVAGETFDLVLCNPPFVISPDDEYVFRDGGPDADALCRSVVQEAGGFLAEGGRAFVLCNWICRRDEPAWRPLERWVAGSGCSAILLAYESTDPLVYASRFNESLAGDPAAFEAAVSRWLDYYEAREIDAIGYGAVVLRRRSGDDWVHGFEVTTPPAGEASRHVTRLFDAADEAPRLEGEALLRSTLRWGDGHRLDQRLVHRDGDYEISDVAITRDDTVGIVTQVAPAALDVLFRIDGSTSVAAAIDAAVAASDGDRAELVETATAAIRALHAHGLLEPVQA